LATAGPRQFEPIVWWLRTDRIDDGCQERLHGILDRTEQGRARRFVSAQDQRDFIVCHALLRVMLSRTAGRPPGTWTFSPGPHGKPGVAAEHGLPDLQFNITHTRGLVAVALSWRGPIGVDAQILDAALDEVALAKRFFAAAEAELVTAASALERPRVFAQLWTLKEAYIKATGLGLSTPLDSFAFGLAPLGVEFGQDRADPAAWQFASAMVTERHVLSVALHISDAQSRGVTLSEISGGELQAAIA